MFKFDIYLVLLTGPFTRYYQFIVRVVTYVPCLVPNRMFPFLYIKYLAATANSDT